MKDFGESMCSGMGAPEHESEASRAETLPPAAEPSVAPPSVTVGQVEDVLRTTYNPPGWAILELFGHRKRAGWVEEVRVFGVEKARVHIPTEAGELVEDYDGKAVYGTVWCSEATARAAALEINRFDQPYAARQLPARGESLARDPGWDDDDDDLNGPDSDD